MDVCEQSLTNEGNADRQSGSSLVSVREAMHGLATVRTYLEQNSDVKFVELLMKVQQHLSAPTEKSDATLKINAGGKSGNCASCDAETQTAKTSTHCHVDVTVTDPVFDVVGTPDSSMQHIPDHEITYDEDGDSYDENKALNTLPACLSIRRSQIKKDSIGVYSNVLLTELFYFGPYQGEIVNSPDACGASSWFWQISGNDGKVYYIDGSDSSKANWMRFVHCTSASEYHNLKAFQYDGQIFYKVTRVIKPGTELVVCYQCAQSEDQQSENLPTINQGGQTETDTNINCFYCEVCAIVFSAEGKYLTHLRTAHQGCDNDLVAKEVKPSKRIRCMLRLRTKSRRCRTDKKQHACFDTTTGKFKCKNCGKEFAVFSQFRYHERQHTGEKPYQCSDCGRCFRVTGHLRVHQLTHTKNRPYSCRVCGRSFTQSSNLTRHLRIHTGEKPHHCSYCDKKFADATTFKCHLRIHTGEKPYKCMLCGESFISSSRRKAHMITHSRM